MFYHLLQKSHIGNLTIFIFYIMVSLYAVVINCKLAETVLAECLVSAGADVLYIYIILRRNLQSLEQIQ